MTTIFIIALFTRGLYYIAEEGYLLFDLKYWLAAKVFGLRCEYSTQDDTYIYFDASSTKGTWKDFLWKPLWGCVYCMNSFWGVVICLSVGTSLTEAVISIVGACGLSFAIDQIKK